MRNIKLMCPVFQVTRSLWTEQEANHYQTTYPVRGHQGTAVLSEATKSCQQSQLLSCGNGAHRPPMQHMHFQHPKYMQQMSQEHVLNVSQQHGFQSYSNSNSNGNKRFRCDPFSQVGGQVPLSHSMNMVDEDLGIGSLDQITQFNDEVDQIVGTLPFGLFPQATMSKACPKVADDSCVPSQGWAMPNIARPFYGVSGVQEMVQHLLGGGVSQTHQVQQQHQQQPQDEIAESQGKLEEQIGQARNRLNKLLALSRQKQWGNDQRNHTLEPMGCGLQMGCY